MVTFRSNACNLNVIDSIINFSAIFEKESLSISGSIEFDLNKMADSGPFGEGKYYPQTNRCETKLISQNTELRLDIWVSGFLFVSESKKIIISELGYYEPNYKQQVSLWFKSIETPVVNGILKIESNELTIEIDPHNMSSLMMPIVNWQT